MINDWDKLSARSYRGSYEKLTLAWASQSDVDDNLVQQLDDVQDCYEDNKDTEIEAIKSRLNTKLRCR